MPREHLGIYDFVVAPSVNGEDVLEAKMLENVFKCLKVGGILLFRTKQKVSSSDQELIKYYSDNEYWKYLFKREFFH